MRAVVRIVWLAVLASVCAPAWSAEKPAGSWKQVHPRWQNAYVCSFRSPDLLSNEADERWGEVDGRLVSGGILTDFPAWLRELEPDFRAARAAGRPILLSIHVHSGYGTGLVTYSRDLRTAESADYPWLVRQLLSAGLGADDVTVAIDTCNAQATAAHQLRPDLIPGGVASWLPFKTWRKAHPYRKSLSVTSAYRLFARDRVRMHLAKAAQSDRDNVKSTRLEPLTPEERGRFRAQLYGQRGVILGTPAFFNLLRLGPNPTGTMTANLLTARLDGRVVDAYLARNKTEFRRFREFAFLSASGLPADAAAPETPNTAAAPAAPTPRSSGEPVVVTPSRPN